MAAASVLERSRYENRNAETLAGAQLGEEELCATCADQLAGYRVPERIAIVESLQRTSMGKVRRSRTCSLFLQTSQETL